MKLPLVISARQLNQVLGDNKIRLVDLSAHPEVSLPSARLLPYAYLLGSDGSCTNLLPEPAQLAAALNLTGYQPGDHIVAFDDNHGLSASRLYWSLSMLGIESFSYLNGGVREWQRAGYPVAPLDNARANPEPESKLKLAIAEPYRISMAELSSSLDSQTYFLWDARAPQEYAAGHIPGARNLEWSALLDEQGLIRPEPELRQIVAGFYPETDGRTIVPYCQTHRRSSVVFLVLRLLGINTVRCYDGSWSQWGSSSMPIA